MIELEDTLTEIVIRYSNNPQLPTYVMFNEICDAFNAEFTGESFDQIVARAKQFIRDMSTS